MRDWDGLNNPDEPYYRDYYWDWISHQLETRGSDLSGKFLDAACGPGRLLLPLAQHVSPHGGRVTGVDLLGSEIETARRHLESHGVGDVALRESDVLEFLRDQPDESFEAVVFVGVALTLPKLDAVMAELHRVIRRGGLLLADFRTQYFLLLLGVGRRDWELARIVLRQRSGSLPGMGWHNWHTSRDAIALLEGAGFERVELFGAGVCSGIAGDPLSLLARPGTMSAEDLAELARVERAFAPSHPDVGRYMLAAATRPPAESSGSGQASPGS